MRNIFLAIVIILISFGLACKKNSSSQPNPNINFSATLNGAKETPANNSTATGSATGTFNIQTKILTLTITYSGLTPIAGHIHKGAQTDPPGPVVFPFTDVSTTPFNFTSPVLTAAQEADLMAGLYYVNLHTTAYQGGEIRGQITK